MAIRNWLYKFLNLKSPGFDHEHIRGSSRSEDGLIPDWFEIHPLYSGNEFDVAIIGLRTSIPRYKHCLRFA